MGTGVVLPLGVGPLERNLRPSLFYTAEETRPKSDLLYVNDRNLLLICEDAGVFNKNARSVLDDGLKTRNRCGHPTGYVVGREEVVVFIERLINNIISGAMVDWD